MGRTAVLVLLFAAVFLFSFNPFKDSDSFYHLKAGQVVWETRAIPRADIFSYTASGAPWVVHEWLSEVVFYLVFRLAGFWGEIAFVAAISVATYFLMFLTARRRGADSFLALVLFVFVGLLTFELWVGRPQSFSFLFLAALVYCLERYRMTGERRTLVAVLLLLAWANLHASVILGVGVLFWYAGARLAAALLRHELSSSDAWLLAAAAGGALLSLANPQGYKIFFYREPIGATIQALQVLEWQPISAFWHLGQVKAFLFVLVVVDCLIFWWYGGCSGSRDGTVACLVLGVSVLPFISIRYVGYWPMVALPFFAAASSGALRNKIQAVSWRAFLAVGLALAVFLAAAGLARLPRRYFNDQTVPVYAADFLEREGVRGPFFNLYNEGGYLIFRFYPKEKVFIDGRSEVYGPRQVQELFDIVGASPRFNELVTGKYGINAFVLSYRPQVLADNIQPLVAKLRAQRWPLVWWDDSALVFVRRLPENAALIGRFAIRHVDPFRPPQSIPTGELPAAFAEIAALFDRSPANNVLRDYAASLLPLGAGVSP